MNRSDEHDLDVVIGLLEQATRDATEELIPLADALEKDAKRLAPAVAIWADAWSQSNLGPQAVMYYDDNGFRRPPPGKEWDSEWGFLHRQEGWRSVDHDEVVQLIEETAGITLDALATETENLRERLRQHHHALLILADRIPAETGQRVRFDERRAQVETLDSNTTLARQFASPRLTRTFMSRDPRSMAGSIRLAPHENAEVTALAAQALVRRTREFVHAGDRAAATADGIRRLPRLEQDDEGRPALGDATPAASGALDRMAVVVSASALFVVLGLIAVGAAFVHDRADGHIKRSTGTFTTWPLLSAATGGFGVLAVVLAVAVFWHGILRRRRDHVQVVLGKPLAWGAATGLGGALLIIYGIG